MYSKQTAKSKKISLATFYKEIAEHPANVHCVKVLQVSDALHPSINKLELKGVNNINYLLQVSLTPGIRFFICPTRHSLPIAVFNHATFISNYLYIIYRNSILSKMETSSC